MRDWARNNPRVEGWNAGTLVGQHIAMKRANLVHEAFVIKSVPESQIFALLYTENSFIDEGRDLMKDGNLFGVLRAGQYEYNGQEVGTWTT